MGMNWLAFAGGAAQAGSEYIERERKDAAALAESQVNMMYKSYTEKRKERDEKIKQLGDNVAYVRGLFPTATESQLADLAQNPSAMSLVINSVKDKTFHPELIDFSKVANTAKSNSGKTASDIIKEMYDFGPLKKEEQATQEEPVAKEGGIRGFIKGIGDRETETTSRRLANVAGVSLEELRAAKNATMPSYQAQSMINQDAVQKTRPLDDRINEASNAVAATREAILKADRQDPVAMEKAGAAHITALGKLGTLTYAKSMLENKNLTEDQTRKKMRDEMMRLDPNSTQYLKLRKEYEQRVALYAALEGSEETKITTSNEISAVDKAYKAMYQSSLTATGIFVYDPETGGLTPKSTLTMTERGKIPRYEQTARKNAAMAILKNPNFAEPTTQEGVYKVTKASTRLALSTIPGIIIDKTGNVTYDESLFNQPSGDTDGGNDKGVQKQRGGRTGSGARPGFSAEKIDG